MTLDDANRRRAVILEVRPTGCVKRVIGDPIAIEADIVGDGHEVLRAVLVDRAPGASAWRETELVLGKDDTWRATLIPDALGRHRYAVIAWLDTFATWRRGLERKIAAGIDVALELREGAALVEPVDPVAAAKLDVATATSPALAKAMAAAPRG